MNDSSLDRKVRREVLKAAVQRQIFCPVSGHILDVKTAVYVVPSVGPAAVIDPAVWDDRSQGVYAAASLKGVDLDVYDGRQLS